MAVIDPIGNHRRWACVNAADWKEHEMNERGKTVATVRAQGPRAASPAEQKLPPICVRMKPTSTPNTNTWDNKTSESDLRKWILMSQVLNFKKFFQCINPRSDNKTTKKIETGKIKESVIKEAEQGMCQCRYPDANLRPFYVIHS